jgi:antitoxin ParD1/3/4
MPRKLSITIDRDLAEFIDREIKNGKFNTSAEVVEAGLRLLQQHENKLDALRAALIEGEQSGPGEPFDFEEFLKQRRRRRSSSR